LDSFMVPSRILEGDFAGWLRDAMAARGLSTRMLAIRAGINHTTIHRLAAGERQPTLATAVALLRVLAGSVTMLQPAAAIRSLDEHQSTLREQAG
jgi:ribosome-binding protein aMBF1 (putative translation factor)